MKVLLTGCAGFIGSHIAIALLDRGHTVIGIDDHSTGSYKNIDAIRCSKNGENFKWHKASVQGSVDWVLREESAHPITHICHQAALGSIPRSLENPDDTFYANVHSFHRLMEAARKNNIHRVVYASSSSIYGDAKNPYALSKQMNELVASMYSKAYGLHSVGLRYFNVFGPRQSADGGYAAVIPRWIDKIKAGEAIEMHGDGSQSRDFTYVGNVVWANLQALEMGGVYEHMTFDVGCGVSTRLETLALSISSVLEQPLKVFHMPRRPGDKDMSCAVESPFFTNYEKTYLEEGLRLTI